MGCRPGGYGSIGPARRAVGTRHPHDMVVNGEHGVASWGEFKLTGDGRIVAFSAACTDLKFVDFCVGKTYSPAETWQMAW